MKFGASSWPFQWDPPYEDAIRRIAGLGFKAIELIAWNADFLEDYYTKPRSATEDGARRATASALSQFVSHPARPVAAPTRPSATPPSSSGSGRSTSVRSSAPRSSTW